MLVWDQQVVISIIPEGESMIKGLDHIAIAVKNIEETLAVYGPILGMKIQRTKVVEQQKVRISILKAGDTKIELLEPLSDESTVAKFLQNHGEGLHHIALEVSNIDDHLKDLKDKGMTLIDEKPRPGAEARKIAFIHPKSTKNVLIELVEH